MQLSDHDLETLESWWDGTLPEPASSQLAERLERDADFSREAEAYRALLALMRHTQQQPLRAAMQQWEAALPPARHTGTPFFQRRSTRWAMAMAAAIALLLVARLFLLPSSNDCQQMASRYFEHYAALELSRSAAQPTLLERGLALYEQHRYEAAMPLLDECFRSTHDTTALYYYGIAAIGNGQPEKAAPALQTVLASTSVYRENAAWYLALSRVQACQKAEALPLLDEIARGDGAHRMQAAQLAKELR